jgi:hypothetical protein
MEDVINKHVLDSYDATDRDFSRYSMRMLLNLSYFTVRKSRNLTFVIYLVALCLQAIESRIIGRFN